MKEFFMWVLIGLLISWGIRWVSNRPSTLEIHLKQLSAECVQNNGVFLFPDFVCIRKEAVIPLNEN